MHNAWLSMPGRRNWRENDGEALLVENRILWRQPQAAHRVLEASLPAKQCGTTFFREAGRLSLSGKFRVGASQHRSRHRGHSLIASQLGGGGGGGFVDRRNYEEFAVFWPVWTRFASRTTQMVGGNLSPFK